jgi:hypothetical protein
MQKIILIGIFVCFISLTTPASAAPLIASGAATVTPDGSNFDYSITLTNSSASTVSLGTFWFAWVPGQDFLPTNPISETSPSGWAVNLISHEGSSDGFAIQWVANNTANDLAPGKSLVFGFKSPDLPAVLSGASQFFPGTPIGTSFVYQGGPFVGASDQFTVAIPAAPPSVTTVSAGTTSTTTTASTATTSDSTGSTVDASAVPEPSSLWLGILCAAAPFVRLGVRHKR